MRCARSMRPAARSKAAIAIESVAALLETIVEHVADTMDRIADASARPSTRSRNRCCRTARRICAKTSAGCGGPASGCIGRLSGLRVVFHRFEQKHLDDLKPPCGSTPASWRSASTGWTTPSSRCANAAGCCRRSCISRSRSRATTISRCSRSLTAMLMPPTLVTGIFGMNTKGLPFTDLETAFLWAALLMVCRRSRLTSSCGASASSGSVTGRDHRGCWRCADWRQRRLVFGRHGRAQARSPAPRTKARPNGWPQNGSTNGMTGLPTRA